MIEVSAAPAKKSVSLGGQSVSLVIRYDDYGAAYSPACAARFDVEQMVCGELAQRGWPWVCSITPQQSVNPFDAEESRVIGLWEDGPRVALLRRTMADGLCEPGVHGLTHRTWKQLPRYGTEFAGLPADRQYAILRQAKREVEELTERPVTLLVPPWNSFDQATVEAAARAGFEVISGGVPACCRTTAPLRHVPITLEPADLKRLVEQKRRLPPGTLMVLMFHAFDFVCADKERGFLRLDEFGPLLDRAVDELGLQVLPLQQVPELLGADLEERVTQSTELYAEYHRLRELPVAGPSFSRRVLAQAFCKALVPVKTGRRIGLAIRALGCLWLALAAGVMAAPALVLSLWEGGGTARTAALLAWGLGGAALAIRGARYACLKRFCARWGDRTIGWRTWTSMVGGFSAGLTAGLGWVLSGT